MVIYKPQNLDISIEMQSKERGVMISILPPDNDLNIGCLCRLFKDTTTSYKYLYFRAILQSIFEDKFSKNVYDLYDIVVKMLIDASYPYINYHLFFGITDQIAKTIEKCCKGNYKDIEGTLKDQKNKSIIRELLKYVPFRLLSGFFENELRGIDDQFKNKKIIDLANTKFDIVKPFYKFIENNEKIQIHDYWINYFRINYTIVRAWADWEWMQYLQQKNPSVPAISQKLYPPPQRLDLTKQTKYWKNIIIYREVKCIYSNDDIYEDYSFALDHFLPWSFIGHNQLWNLIPVNPKANSSKSDSLPSIQKYFDKFINLQYCGLICSQKIFKPKDWEKLTECYVVDLKVGKYDDLLNKETLEQKYKNTIMPLMQIAENIGFVKDWKY